MQAFLRFLEVLDILARFGRLRGTNSPNVREKRFGGSRVMTKNQKNIHGHKNHEFDRRDIWRVFLEIHLLYNSKTNQ